MIETADALKSQAAQYIALLAKLVATKNGMDEALKSLGSEISAIRLDALPQIMAQLNQTEATFATGHKIKTQVEVTCRLPSEEDTYELVNSETGECTQHSERDDALNALISYGEEAAITNNVTVRFTRAEYKEAMRAVAVLKNAGFEDVEVGQEVHSGTLKKIIKQRLHDGLPLNTALFRVHMVHVASVKLGRIELK